MLTGGQIRDVDRLLDGIVALQVEGHTTTSILPINTKNGVDSVSRPHDFSW